MCLRALSFIPTATPLSVGFFIPMLQNKVAMIDTRPFLLSRLHYAVVGATTDRAKYGYRVLMDLHQAGFSVVGVNPKYHEVEGITCYPTLASVPHKPDVAIVVVPPQVGLVVLDEVAALGITKAWFQPGAESEAIRTKAKSLGLTAQADGSCIMVARRALSGTM